MTYKGKKHRIKRSDYNRVLVTETSPFETPLIFSNDGFYDNLARRTRPNRLYEQVVQRVIFNTTGARDATQTVPYKYKVRKGAQGYRQLNILHPLAQIQIRDFYKKYEKLILHFCRRSPISIRAPFQTAGTFYRKISWENIHQYRTGKVTELTVDPFTKYSPSFFAYRGYDRLYKFFVSHDFQKLEKRFPVMWAVDVSKCFDSIYTHCLAWALKDKAFAKEHLQIGPTFANEFDVLMRRINHNESHGIVIGPEVSRIFAELVFQAIDVRAISRLATKFALESDYAIRRYVDDIYIFASEKAVAQKVFVTYADVLSFYSLQVNEKKLEERQRPFVTKKSRTILAASRAVNEFCDKFLLDHKSEHWCEPREIHDGWALTRQFILEIKAICSSNDSGYDELASYLISALTERVKKIVSRAPQKNVGGAALKYRDAVLVLLDVMFFLYSVCPSVNASFKLCTSVIVLIRFAERRLGSHAHVVKEKISELSEQIISQNGGGENDEVQLIEGFLPLETLNVVLAARELGENYLFSEALIRRMFFEKRQFSYFGIVSCLFYIRDRSEYDTVRRKLVKAIDSFFSDMSEITSKAEMACLFLDILGCPYIHEERKIYWISKLLLAFGMPVPSKVHIQKCLVYALKCTWFVRWDEIDVLSALEKKELKQAY